LIYYIRKESEVNADRHSIRAKTIEEAKDQTFNIGDVVEVFGPPNHPSLKGCDIAGWRRAKISNLKGKFIFDLKRYR
jgi:hypothetical protein